MPAIQVFYGREKHTVTLPDDATVGDLKRNVDHLGVPATSVSLICKGRKLEEDAALLSDVAAQGKVMLMKRPSVAGSRKLTLRCLASGRLIKDITVKANEPVAALLETAKKALMLPDHVTPALFVEQGKQILRTTLTLADYQLPDQLVVFVLPVNDGPAPGGNAPKLTPQEEKALAEMEANAKEALKKLGVTTSNHENARANSSAGGGPGDRGTAGSAGSNGSVPPAVLPPRMSTGRGRPIAGGSSAGPVLTSIVLPAEAQAALEASLSGLDLEAALGGTLGGGAGGALPTDVLSALEENLLATLPAELQGAQLTPAFSIGGGGGADRLLHPGRRPSKKAMDEVAARREEKQQESMEELCSRMVANLASTPCAAATTSATAKGASVRGGGGSGGTKGTSSFGSGLAKGFLASKPKRKGPTKAVKASSVAKPDTSAAARARTHIEDAGSIASLHWALYLHRMRPRTGVSVARPPVCGLLHSAPFCIAAATAARRVQASAPKAPKKAPIKVQELQAPAPKAQVPNAPVPKAQVPEAPAPKAQVPKAPVPKARMPEALAPKALPPALKLPASIVAADATPNKENVKRANFGDGGAKSGNARSANTAAAKVVDTAAAKAADKATAKVVGTAAAKGSRCYECDARLPVTACIQCVCRCGDSFCASHMHTHKCPFDYRAGAQHRLRESNPKLAPPKLASCI